MTKIRLMLTTLALATFSLGTVSQQRQIQIWSAGFGPARDIKVKNPKFVWQVWADGDAKITAASFFINGKEVDAKYDNRKKELFFESGDTLAPGTYSVVAHVKVDDWAKFDKKWTVTIRPDAIKNVDEISAETRQVLGIFNRIRADHGFAPVFFDAAFNSAATAHTNYLTLNKGDGHGEDPAYAGYTGMAASDRASLFGHVGSSWEVVSTGAQSASDAIIGLWDAPYHRISMMKPGVTIAGASYKEGNLTIDGDGMTIDGMFVSPPAGGVNVAPSWENNESPDPTRSFDNPEHILGYPVVANVYGDKVGTVSLVSSSFTNSSGAEVDRYELSAANDNHLKNSVILIPKKPLTAGSSYSVNLKLKDGQGNFYTKAWKFTTRARD